VARGNGGQRPRAPELQALSGARPSRINKEAPKHLSASGEPPEDMSDKAKQVWFRTVPELLKFDLLNVVEVEALVAYCEAVVTHREAVDDVRQDGITLVGSMGGLIKNPACTVQKEAAMTIRAFAIEFGLTPAARQNVKAPAAKKDEEEASFFTQATG
jgi:P27 family predicted phage terminase small subunit